MNLYKSMRYLVLYLIFSTFNTRAQTVRINEVVSSNSLYSDEDGDTPDWLELHNYGKEEVSIHGWSLSDDIDNFTKWTFPNITLPPNKYLLLWASSKDRSNISYSRTLINQGDIFKYSIPTSEPNYNWKYFSFNDTNWLESTSGFGYNDGDDATVLPYGTRSIYLRKKFTIDDLAAVSSLILDIDYDDAFVAYINGVEVARANIIGVPPAFDAGTITDHEAKIYAGGTPDRFLITDFSAFLTEGDNILSIQAHNVSAGSSDFTIIPFLSAVFSSPTNTGIEPPAILGLTTNNLHTNFKISSSSETLTLTNTTQDIVDQIVIENLPPDTSIGVSKSSETVVSYLETTPGSENSSSEFLGAVQSEVIFSQEGGLIDQPVSLTLSGNNLGEVIRYTLDGSIPIETSPKYTTPIQINNNMSVRAQMFLQNYLPSPIFTKSYIIGANHEIDVVLLTTDPNNLFNEDTGIYVFGPNGTYDTNIPYYGANFWEDSEKPVHFSFHKNGTSKVSEFDAGIKIFGGWSRGQNGQRSLSLFARGQYGDSKFEDSFFDTLPYDDFQALVLRNSGQDWMRSSMKDIMLTSLMRGSGQDFLEHNPVATYINGDYWGMYNLREKINEHMLASKHNIDANDITLLTNNAEEIEGNNQEYNELITYISSVDLSIDSNFEHVEQQIDLKAYALYQAANIFFNNTDWPGNNIKFWKHPAGKWRWIMYDTDFSFGPFWNLDNYNEDTLSFALEENGPGWPNPSWSTLLFRKLITNIGFRNRFINRYADELNTRFLSTSVNTHIDHIYSTIEPEINAHYEHWKSDPSLTNFGVIVGNVDSWVGGYIDAMKVFADRRPSIAKEHLKSQFNLPEDHPLTIINPSISEGFVQVNENLKIQESFWIGDYFETVSIQLTAIPEAGYEFSHWSGDVTSTEATIRINLVDSFQVTPNFLASDSEVPLVINEINYKSSDDFNADDWVELYNPNAFSKDLSNWQLKDDDDLHVYTIPVGTSIAAGGYLVIVKDASDFSTIFPGIPNYIGEIDFGFGSSDAVRLYNANNVLQDQVFYTNEIPWSDCAKGTGNTLELISPNLDNSLAESWKCINSNGSPNAINTSLLSLDKELNTSVKIYPNPVQNTLYVSGVTGQFEVQVYSVAGQEVFRSSNKSKLDVSQLKQGIYIIKVSEDQKNTLLKFIKQ